MSEDKKSLQKKVQGNYRRKKNEVRDRDFNEKEFIIILIIISVIYLLHLIFPEF